MHPTDDELLSFDFAALGDFDVDDARRQLKTFGDAYRFQLVAALDLERRADELGRPGATALYWPKPDVEQVHSYQAALRDVAAWLRCGEFLPGGWVFDHMSPDKND
jgi:hypothetical protein